MSVVYYTASSLDGFVVDADDSLGWLLSRDIDGSAPFGYDVFRPTVGAVVVGATTVRWVLREEGGTWPFTLPTWVFTHDSSMQVDGGDVRVVSGDVTDHHAAVVESAGDLDVWLMGGGALARQYVDAGLVDEVAVQYAPCTLGAGAPVLPTRSEWELVDHGRNGDFLCARWRVVRGSV